MGLKGATELPPTSTVLGPPPQRREPEEQIPARVLKLRSVERAGEVLGCEVLEKELPLVPTSRQPLLVRLMLARGVTTMMPDADRKEKRSEAEKAKEKEGSGAVPNVTEKEVEQKTDE